MGAKCVHKTRDYGLYVRNILRVHDLCWHPLGHILTSTGKDNSTKFWSRNYPGDDMADKHNAPQLPEDRKAAAIKSLKQAGKLFVLFAPFSFCFAGF